MNHLSRLARKEKIGILYIPFFVIGMVVSSIVINSPAPSGGSIARTVQSLPSPSAASPQSAGTTSANATAEASAPIAFTTDDVPRAELTTMQEKADVGLTNFYQWNAGESSSDRIQRMSPYFSSTSSALNMAPDGSSLSDPKNSSLSLVSHSTINYMKPVSGTSSEYRLSASVTVSGQYNYLKNTQQNQSMILEKINAVSVLMKKVDGTWKVESIEEKQ
jgi:hypothetical protein